MTTVPPPGGSGEGTVAGGFLPAGGVTVAAVVGEFLATRGSVQTRRAYGAAVQGLFQTAGVTLLAELHPEVRPPAQVAQLVRAYLDAVTKRAATEPWRVVNPAMVNARASALRAFFAWLMQAYGYPVNRVASGDFNPLTSKRAEANTQLGLLFAAVFNFSGNKGAYKVKLELRAPDETNVLDGLPDTDTQIDDTRTTVI